HASLSCLGCHRIHPADDAFQCCPESRELVSSEASSPLKEKPDFPARLPPIVRLRTASRVSRVASLDRRRLILRSCWTASRRDSLPVNGIRAAPLVLPE